MSELLIRAALKAYGLENASWELIRHNENLTVNVEDRYLLRVHQHAEGFSTDAYYEGLDRAALRKRELDFLSYLNARGMAVQTPVASKDGEYVVTLPGGVRATMLTWLPGHTPREEDVPQGVYARAGAMVARMHRAAIGFPTEGLLRYDAPLCRKLMGWVSAACQEGLLAPSHAEGLLAALAVIADRLRDVGDLVVHADLSSSNLLVTDAGLVPIDFSLMGVGHPMLDIACLFCGVNGLEARQQIAEGYRGEGGVMAFPELDACFALNILLYVVLHLRGSGDMAARLDRWQKRTFGPLAEGKRLIGDDFRMLHAPD